MNKVIGSGGVVCAYFVFDTASSVRPIQLILSVCHLMYSMTDYILTVQSYGVQSF